MSNQLLFVPSTAAVSGTPDNAVPVVVQLPAPDASNPDVLVTSTVTGSVFVAFGALPSGQMPGGVNNLEVKGHGRPVLVVADTTVAASLPANPFVVTNLPTAATATVATIGATTRGGSVTFQRGKASVQVVFGEVK